MVNYLVATISAKFDDHSTSDLVFEVEGQAIHVHRSHVMFMSPHLAVMLSERWCNTKHVVLTSYSYLVFYKYLRYLYTGEIDCSRDTIEQICDLAHCYLEDDLKQRCETFIKKTLTSDDVSIFYQLANRYSLDKLKLFIVDFAERNLGESTVELFSALAAQFNVKTLKHSIEDFIAKHLNHANFKIFYRAACSLQSADLRLKIENRIVNYYSEVICRYKIGDFFSLSLESKSLTFQDAILTSLEKCPYVDYSPYYKLTSEHNNTALRLRITKLITTQHLNYNPSQLRKYYTMAMEAEDHELSVFLQDYLLNNINDDNIIDILEIHEIFNLEILAPKLEDYLLSQFFHMIENGMYKKSYIACKNDDSNRDLDVLDQIESEMRFDEW